MERGFSMYVPVVDTIVGATCSSSGNDLFRFFRGKHIFEADSILLHMVRYNFSSFGKRRHPIMEAANSRMTHFAWDEVS